MKAESTSIPRLLTIAGCIALILATPARLVCAEDTAPTALPRVTKVAPDHAGLENEIVVTVAGAVSLRPEALGKEKLILFLDGLPLTGVYAYNGLDARGNGQLRFLVEHTAEPIEMWRRFVASRDHFNNIFERQVSVSVGAANGVPIATDVNGFKLVLVRKEWFFASLSIDCALVLLLWIVSIKTDMLREAGPPPSPGCRRPYSLGRVQMAIWTMNIIVAWLLLYVLRHTLDTIPDSLVALMGISAGTGVVSAHLGDAASKGGETDSRGFLMDVLGTQNGVRFHRFQLLAWTVVATAVFWRQVVSYFAMPDFPISILTLMGISSGTFIGFKSKESPKPGAEPETQSAVEAGQADG